jgi:hypothetical protein
MEWTKFIPGYENMTSTGKAELRRAMEEASAPHIYSNWHAAKYLLLHHIKDHLSAIGVENAIFAHDEYQGEAGNPCLGHIILAVNPSTMNGESEKYVQDLIRTSTLTLTCPYLFRQMYVQQMHINS